MNKLILFLLLLTMIACGGAQKNNTTIGLADTLGSKKSYNAKSILKDTVKSSQAKIEEPEEGLLDKLHEDFIQKAVISKSDSSLTIYQNIRDDYRIFGYQEPDTNSRKLLLVSVFTSDVEGNPYNCVYGSYYGSGAMQDMKMKYTRAIGGFVEVNLIRNNIILTPIFFEKSWVEFDN